MARALIAALAGGPLLVGLLLGAAACSDDDGTGEADADTEAVAAAEGDVTTTTTAFASTASTEDHSTTMQAEEVDPGTTLVALEEITPGFAREFMDDAYPGSAVHVDWSSYRWAPGAGHSLAVVADTAPDEALEVCLGLADLAYRMTASPDPVAVTDPAGTVLVHRDGPAGACAPAA